MQPGAPRPPHLKPDATGGARPLLPRGRRPRSARSPRPPRWLRAALLGASLGAALAACDDGDPPPATPSVPTLSVCAAEHLAAPTPAPSAPAWLSVWGAHDDAVFVVGGGATEGAALRFDGAALSALQLPVGPPLWWVWGHGPEAVWAVGEAGRIVRLTPTPTEEIAGLDPRAILYGVWGSGPTDLWAVGGSTIRGGPKAVVLRSAGDGVWRRVLDPALPTEDPDNPLVGLNLYKVWGQGPDAVVLVGEGGLIVEFDGTRFTRRDVAPPFLMFTVAGDAHRRFAVGGLAEGALAADGPDGWARPPAPPLPALNGVAVDAAGAVWLAGDRGFIGRFEPEDRASNQPPPAGELLAAADLAGAWCRQPPDPADAGRIYHAVWAGPTRTWVVGGDLVNRTEGRIRVTAPRPAAPALDAPTPHAPTPNAPSPGVEP